MKIGCHVHEPTLSSSDHFLQCYLQACLPSQQQQKTKVINLAQNQIRTEVSRDSDTTGNLAERNGSIGNPQIDDPVCPWTLAW